MLRNHLHLFFSELSLHSFSPFFYGVVGIFYIYLYKFLMFQRSMYFKYFSMLVILFLLALFVEVFGTHTHIHTCQWMDYCLFPELDGLSCWRVLNELLVYKFIRFYFYLLVMPGFSHLCLQQCAWCLLNLLMSTAIETSHLIKVGETNISFKQRSKVRIWGNVT